MSTKKRVLSLFFAVVLAFSLVSVAAHATAPEVQSGDIVVLSTNDVHCATITTIADLYAKLAAYRTAQEAIAGKGNVTLVDAGDAVQGDNIGTMTNGEAITDIMNHVGYDLAVPGNHEFDYGMDGFMNLVSLAQFPYISCNFMDLKTDAPVFDGYQMMTYGDVKVAYVGITTPEAITKSAPVYFQDKDGNWIYGFCQDATGQALYDQVQATVDAARADGANYVIGVGHLGVDSASSPWTSKEVIANTTGIDAMFDGHSHTVIDGETVQNKDGEDVTLVQGGYKMANISEIVIHSDGSISGGVVPTAGLTDVDTGVQTYINDEIVAPFKNQLNTVVAHSDVNLTVMNPYTGSRAVRMQETNLGDLCADAYRNILGADIGWVNGGGVRADIKAGDITYANIISVHPFGNMACMIEATGQQILDALEFSVSQTPAAEFGGFLQVSGLQFNVDATIPSPVVTDANKMFVKVGDGDRRVSDVLVDGKPIDPAKTYTVASIDYELFMGGDGYPIFQHNTVLKDRVMVDSQVLITYITKNLGGNVGQAYANPLGQGRINIKHTQFDDVLLADWFAAPVKYAADNGIIKGVSDTTFDPQGSLNRAMVATMLYRMEDSPEVTAPAAFSDVVAGSWYADAVAWAAANGIVKGYEDGTFHPLAAISRQEMATMIFRYIDLKGHVPADYAPGDLTYTDAGSIASWAANAVAFCTENKILNGMGNNTFAPADTSTRAQGATVMQRLMTTDFSPAPAA
ncbi:MAG: 5'-nucleotidase C-terminal domain-containing protein [Firmicutes bacterium]|nr:5'-nucleotidase C-terminal domain-containing protein [Bacillota bacterium]